MGSAEAQNMESLFAHMPDSIIPVMSETNRLDCIDFFKSNMTSKVTNLYYGTSSISEMTDDFMRLAPTAVSTVEIRAYRPDSLYILLAYTYCSPAKETTIRIYNGNWLPLNTQLFIELPKKEEFIRKSATGGDDKQAKAEAILHDAFVYATVDKDSGSLSFQLSTEGLSPDDLKTAEPYIGAPITYEWTGHRFERK